MEHFGHARFHLDFTEERLWKDGTPVRLSRKTFELLRFLTQNPNRLLTNDEIREALWSGIHVTGGLVKEYIHDLRVALGDDPRAPRFIETVRGRGYRFIGDIRATGDEARQDRADVPDATPSLAVLPLDNLTGDEHWSDFCHGIRDDLVTDLARMPEAVVFFGRSASSSDRDQMADGSDPEPRASYMLGGSLQSFEAFLRINLHLSRTRDCRVVWAHRYERATGELSMIRDDIAPRLVSALQAVLRGSPGPDGRSPDRGAAPDRQ